MNNKLQLQMKKAENGYVPEFFITDGENNPFQLLRIPHPFLLEIWNSTFAVSGRSEITGHYKTIKETAGGITAESYIETPDGGCFKLVDVWRCVDSDTFQVDRKLCVEKGMPSYGFRLRLDVATAFPGGTRFTDLRYFAPPTLYDKNDLDEDGIEDYLGTQNLLYREDRLNMLAIMAYHEQHKLSMTLIRADQPEFDSNPDRPNKERTFMQKTDIGSLGVWTVPNESQQVQLRAAYPFYEGEKTYALLMQERIDWGAFWPAETGESIEVSYRIRVETAPSFVKAMWQTFTRRLKDLDPHPVPLPAAPDELIRYRAEALDRYYIELDAAQDPNEPAGYVLNCHPQDGIQLSDIIQYGFTGQNILSAYNVLRLGYSNGNSEYIRKARRLIDFFVKKVHIPDIGIFYNHYSIDKGTFDFWWTGLLLPLAYAEGEELEKEMGPLYKHREFVIKHLKERKGSYLRCMNEDSHALLLAYAFEKDLGYEHTGWLETGKRYGEFLLKTQEADGSWYRAYDMEAKPITVPEIWFGTTAYEQKSSTASTIPFLIKLYELTGDERFLEAGLKAGRYVKKTFVDGVKFNGGIHDSIYSKGQLVDNESILFPMFGLYALYKVTGDDDFWQGALDAAHIFATWTCLWDVPLPSGSTLAKYGFRSTGIGACDTCGAGYVHPFELMGVAETAEIAIKAGDKELLRVAELLWHGCNQTVAVPEKDWGYKYIGLQEEGYFISWWAADDPMFGETGFGHRWKGEGNKTCFPWIGAVAMASYWKLMDCFGTTEFSHIRKKFEQ